MKALRNMAAELSAQFELKGALAQRLGLVLSIQAMYVVGRLAGLSQGDSLNLARDKMAAIGAMQHVVRLWHPDARCWMEVDLYAAASLAKEILVGREYEEAPGFAPEPGQTVVDCGAHQGLFTLRAAARVGPSGRVVSVEAHPVNAALLRRNAAAAMAAGNARVDVVEAAALERSGTTQLFVTEAGSGGQTTQADLLAKPRPALTIPARRLDDALAELGAAAPALIKLDVEGAAIAALEGAPRTVAARPKIVMEVEGGAERESRARAWLEAHGYAVEAKGSMLYARPA